MADDGPKTITLIDPDGGECLVSRAADINTLVYGQGYKVKDGKTPEEAIAVLAEQAVEVTVQPLAVPETKVPEPKPAK